MNVMPGRAPQPHGASALPVADDPRALRSPVRLALFRLYLHTLIWRRFSAVRISRTGVPARYENRPLLVFTNHPGWWDPAIIGLVSNKLFPGRTGFGPMDAAELRRYALFRRMGAFAVEPTPRGAVRFLEVGQQVLQTPRAMLWVTAEGRFTDPRVRPITLRAGIAHLARRVPDAVFLPAALDYVFWNESRPEALLRFGEPVSLPSGGGADDWRAAMEAALEACADALAAESMTRDPRLFRPLLMGTAGVGGVYDWWRVAKSFGRDTVRHDPEHQGRP